MSQGQEPRPQQRQTRAGERLEDRYKRIAIPALAAAAEAARKRQPERQMTAQQNERFEEQY